MASLHRESKQGQSSCRALREGQAWQTLSTEEEREPGLGARGKPVLSQGQMALT